MSKSSGTLPSTIGISDYWTPERIRAAKPRSLLPLKPRSSSPAVGAGKRAGKGHEPDRSGRPAVAGADAAYGVPDPLKPPFCAIGKLTFNLGEDAFTGTAFAVDETGLMTAAHNLMDWKTQTRATNIMYIPAYQVGLVEFGFWHDQDFIVAPEWKGEADYDLGLIKLKTGGKQNLPIGQVTGWLNVVVNRPPDKWTAVGYPKSRDDAEKMYADPGDFVDWENDKQLVTKTGDLSDDSEGISGGPWLLGEDSDSANGVFAGGTGAVSASPYFDDWVTKLMKDYFGR